MDLIDAFLMCDDITFYSILAALLAGVLIGFARTMPGCNGNCMQGDKPCNCMK